jgi:hypothetical protein
MMNAGVSQQTAAESMSQVSSYFQAVDNAVLMGDTNKRYRPSTNGCYAPSIPVNANSYTTLVISPSFDNTADLWNSYIYAEMKLTFHLDTALVKEKSWWPAAQGATPFMIWAGFKDSMDAIEKYEIVANGITKYTQNFSIEESFITAATSVDTAQKQDTFSRTRHKDIWDTNHFGTNGVYLLTGATDETTSNGPKNWPNQVIKLKIPIRRFLPLSNIKYLPAFGGKIELRVLFSTAGLVWCPVDPFRRRYNIPLHSAKCVCTGSPAIEFQPIGYSSEIPIESTFAENGMTGLVIGPRTLSADPTSVVMQKLDSCIYCFGIADQLYQGLKSRYTSMTLTFPTQVLNIASMSNLLTGTTPKSSQTITPRFIDTIFFLFPLKSGYRTVFRNPGFFQWYLTAGGFGQYPDIPYGTIREPRLIELIKNGVNLNSNQIGLSEELHRSILGNDTTQVPIVGYNSMDRTSFLLAIPMETDNTFQQGQTSATPINYELNITQNTGADLYGTVTERPPLICLLQDATISIQVMADGSPSLVEVGPFDITSPVSG